MHSVTCRQSCCKLSLISEKSLKWRDRDCGDSISGSIYLSKQHRLEKKNASGQVDFPWPVQRGKYFVFFNMLMSFNYRRLQNRGVPFQWCTIQLHTVICTDSVRKRCSRIWPLKGTCTLSVTTHELLTPRLHKIVQYLVKTRHMRQ